MRENLPTSIYLPKKLKEQLVEMARAAEFTVARGRKSGLAKFVEQMLQLCSKSYQYELIYQVGFDPFRINRVE